MILAVVMMMETDMKRVWMCCLGGLKNKKPEAGAEDPGRAGSATMITPLGLSTSHPKGPLRLGPILHVVPLALETDSSCT